MPPFRDPPANDGQESLADRIAREKEKIEALHEELESQRQAWRDAAQPPTETSNPPTSPKPLVVTPPPSSRKSERPRHQTVLPNQSPPDVSPEWALTDTEPDEGKQRLSIIVAGVLGGVAAIWGVTWLFYTPPHSVDEMAPSTVTLSEPESSERPLSSEMAVTEPVSAPEIAVNEPVSRVTETVSAPELPPPTSEELADRYRSRLIEAAVETPPVEVPLQIVVSPLPPEGTVFRDRLTIGQFGPEMVVLPATTAFTLGSPSEEADRRPNEAQITVTLDAFAIGRYEVTFDEYETFARDTQRAIPNDQNWGRGTRPVIGVDWQDTAAYTAWLSEQTGHIYRLPTEAEWEYAARAHTTTRYSWGDELPANVANCVRNCSDRFVHTAPVGQFAPNGFGLFDMHGNVWEWTCSLYQNPYGAAATTCSLPTDEDLVVMRGGSWSVSGEWLRSAARHLDHPTHRSNQVGFRVVRGATP